MRRLIAGNFVMLALMMWPMHNVHAQPVAITPWMTGQRLVHLYEARRPGETMGAEKLREMQAEAYVDGVHDATEGKGWCYSEKYKPKPATIQGHVIWDLRAMSAEQLKRNAADLIVELLQKRYPCGGRP